MSKSFCFLWTHLRQHCSEPVNFHEYPELNVGKLWMHSKKAICTSTSLCVCSILSYITLKTQCTSGCKELQPKDRQISRSQNNFPFQLKFLILSNSTAQKKKKKKAIMLSLWVFTGWKVKIQSNKTRLIQSIQLKYFVEKFPSQYKITPLCCFFLSFHTVLLINQEFFSPTLILASSSCKQNKAEGNQKY